MRFRGYALVLCGAILFGVAASLSKLLLNMGLAPVELSFSSQLIAGLLFLPTVRRRMFVRRDWWILLFPNQLPSETQLAGGTVMVLALIGLYLIGEPHCVEGPPTSKTLSASARDGPRSP